VPAYFIRTSLAIFSKGFVRSAVDRIRRVWPAFLQPLTLECGWPISPGFPVCARNDVAMSELLDELAQAADAEAARCKVRIIVIRDFLEDELNEASGLGSRGFAKIGNLPTAVLHIRWKSFDEYLNDMRSRHRVKVRRGLAIAERSGLSVRVRHSFSDIGEELMREWRNVHEYADEYSREELTAGFYRGFGAATEGQAQLIEVLRGDRRVAHALIFLDGGILRWLFFGRDRPEERDGAYFLVIAEIVRLAIEHQLEIVEMGLTTYSPKTDYGAQMVALWVFVRFRGALLGRLLPGLVNLLNLIPGAKPRKVFRRTTGSASGKCRASC
jgi:predicted N-acyltransferase